MTNRKLKKILKQNAIDSPKQQKKRSFSINIPRRALIRLAQTAACLLLVAAMGVGYVAMVRMVGRQGTPDGSTPGIDVGPGSQFGDPGEDTGIDVVTTPDPQETTVSHGIPTTFDGQKLVVAELFKEGTSGNWWEFSNPDMSGDTMDMISLNRLMLAEQELDCDIMQAASGSVDQYISWIKNSALINSSAAIVTGGADVMATLAAQGLLEDWMSEQAAAYRMDFSAPYWPEDMARELKIGNKLYFVSGKISANTIASVYVVFADPNINSMLDIDIQCIVEDGKWTFDKMYELSAAGHTLDKYGLVLYDDSLVALAAAAGVRISDNSPAPHASLSNGVALNFVNTLADKQSAGDIKLISRASSEYIPNLFTVDTVANSYTMEDVCLLLPLPTLSEDGKHLSPVGESAVYYSVAKGSDIAPAYAVLHSLAKYSSQSTTYFHTDSMVPSYTELISWRYAANDDSVRNLELAVDNMTFSPDAFLPSSTSSVFLKNAINAADSTARKEILTKSNLEQIIETHLGTIK